MEKHRASIVFLPIETLFLLDFVQKLRQVASASEPLFVAEKSGLQKGDFLISLDGEKLDSREELTILISLKKPNDLISLEYLRDRAELSVKIALGARPQN